MIRRPPTSTPLYSPPASDVYKRQKQAIDCTLMIIVTGSNGFIGSNLVSQLNKAGLSDILGVDDLSKKELLPNIEDCEFTDLIGIKDFNNKLSTGSLDKIKITHILHQGACSNTMEWDAFIGLAQMITGGATFIVALFLAFQLLLQHKDAQRELTLDVSAQLERFRLTIGSDPAVAELWDRGRNDFEELTNQVERTQFYFLASTFMNHYALLEDFGGLMKYDTEPLLFRSLATSPGVRKMYKDCLLYTSPSPRDRG